MTITTARTETAHILPEDLNALSGQIVDSALNIPLIRHYPARPGNPWKDGTMDCPDKPGNDGFGEWIKNRTAVA